MVDSHMKFFNFPLSPLTMAHLKRLCQESYKYWRVCQVQRYWSSTDASFIFLPVKSMPLLLILLRYWAISGNTFISYNVYTYKDLKNVGVRLCIFPPNTTINICKEIDRNSTCYFMPVEHTSQANFWGAPSLPFFQFKPVEFCSFWPDRNSWYT